MQMTDRTSASATVSSPVRRLALFTALATVAALLLAAGIATRQSPEHASPPSLERPAHRAATPPATDSATIATSQHQAEQAVIRETVSSIPDTVDVTQRPAYASEMEWQVLQGIAQQHANPEQELARLLRKLHFSRRLELWHAMNDPAQVPQRLRLATQLLEAIPMQVASHDMDIFEARKLQATLLDTLIADPVLRAERIDTEARRLTQMITPADSPGE